MSYWLLKDKATAKDGSVIKPHCKVCGRKIVAAIRIHEESGDMCCDRDDCIKKWDDEVLKQQDPEAYRQKQKEIEEMEADAKRLRESDPELKAIEEDAKRVKELYDKESKND